MRIWSIHPRYLDWKGLGALWRETLLAQVVVQGKTRGWKNHPQLSRFQSHHEPLEAVGYFLKKVHDESLRRGYNYNFSKILKPVVEVEKILITSGQLRYELDILNERLMERGPSKYQENKDVYVIEPHPIFRVVEGAPEPWEKAYWRTV